MAAPKRSSINLPGRQIAPNENPSFSAMKPQDITFLVGDIKSVDIDRQKIIVDFRDNYGSGIAIDITQPFFGTNSFIQATPQVNSIVLVANRNGDYFPIAYLPSYSFGLEGKNVKVWADNVKTQNKNEVFFKGKKLREGWIALSSKDDIEVLLSNHFKVSHSKGNSFVLRPEDNAIINTSNNNYVFSGGVWRNAGIVCRNSISPIDFADIPNVFKSARINGKDSYAIRPYNSDDSSDPYLTEYLLEVGDRDFSTSPMNDVNFSSNKTIRKPIAIFSLGNLIGNNPNDGNYGRVLRPIVFSDPDDNIGDFSLEPISQEDLDTYAAAVTLYKPDRTNPDSGAYFGIDKEGHFYQFIPSATGGGLGKGRSMSILARGSKKEIWGQDSQYANSWDLKTVGGIKWDIGTHNERDGNPYSNRSMDIRTSKSVFFMYGSNLSPDIADFDKKDTIIDNVRKYYKIEKVGGYERKEITGTRESIIGGSDKLSIKGAKIERISGACTINVGSGYNVIVGDAFTEKVTKEKNENFGNRKTIINSGNSELKINSLKGDIIETITKVGSRKLTIKTGNIEENITAGSRKFKTKTGSFTASTKSGSVSLSTKVGQISFKTDGGKATIKATQNIDVKTTKAANVNISGGSINLKGRMGNSGGVITTKTHFDYITGAPLKGSTTVKATM